MHPSVASSRGSAFRQAGLSTVLRRDGHGSRCLLHPLHPSALSRWIWEGANPPAAAKQQCMRTHPATPCLHQGLGSRVQSSGALVWIWRKPLWCHDQSQTVEWRGVQEQRSRRLPKTPDYGGMMLTEEEFEQQQRTGASKVRAPLGSRVLYPEPQIPNPRPRILDLQPPR